MLFIDRTSVFRLASLHSVSVLFSWTIFFSLALNVYASSTKTYLNSPTKRQSQYLGTDAPEPIECPPLPKTNLTVAQFAYSEDLVELPLRIENTILSLKNSFETYTVPKLNKTEHPVAIKEYLKNMDDAMKLSSPGEREKKLLEVFRSTAIEVTKIVAKIGESAIWHNNGFDGWIISHLQTHSYRFSFKGQTDKVIVIAVRLFFGEHIKSAHLNPPLEQNIPTTLALFRIILGLERLSKLVKGTKFHQVDFNFILDGRSQEDLVGLLARYRRDNLKPSFLMVNQIGYNEIGIGAQNMQSYFSKPFKLNNYNFGTITKKGSEVQVVYFTNNIADHHECGYYASFDVDCTMYSGSQNPTTVNLDPGRFKLTDEKTELAVNHAVQYITSFILANAVDYSR